MSRDWTPREQYYADIALLKDGKGSLRGMTDFMRFVYNGVEQDMYTEEQRKVMNSYKELGFLFGDGLCKIWSATQAHPRKRKWVLDDVERELEELIETDKQKKSIDKFDETIVKWYCGSLDENFYYNELNNKLFEDYLYKRIMGI